MLSFAEQVEVVNLGKRIWALGACLAYCGSIACSGASDGTHATGSTSGEGSTGSGGTDSSTSTMGSPAGNQTSTTGSSNAPETAEEFFSQYVELLCPSLAACCTAAGIAFSEAVCRARLDFPDAGLGDTGYDMAAGARCLTQLRADTEDCSPDGTALCDDVFVGLAALGDNCTQTADCARSSRGNVSCDFASVETSSGVCVVEIRAELGEPCVGTCFENEVIRSCSYTGPDTVSDAFEQPFCYQNDDLYCDAESRTCLPAKELGASCSSSSECGAFSSCADVCGAALEEGETCDGDGECEEGLTCNGTCDPEESAGLESACFFLGQDE